MPDKPGCAILPPESKQTDLTWISVTLAACEKARLNASIGPRSALPMDTRVASPDTQETDMTDLISPVLFTTPNALMVAQIMLAAGLPFLAYVLYDMVNTERQPKLWQQ